MVLLLLSTSILVASGCAALLSSRSVRWCTGLGAGGAVAACLLGFLPAVSVVLGSPAESLRLQWDVPYGAFSVALDALSAFFLLPIFALSAAAAVYGAGYLDSRKARLGPAWFFFDLLVASMVVVVIARNGVLFLVAWEVMALTSFFLVTFDDEQAEVRDAGWVYLVATHLGTAFLVVLFVLLGQGAGTLDFARMGATSAPAGLLFVLAVVGFGTKAGLMPFHAWLPEAHPAAPTHVSALMSGVMIKTGIYGLLRVLTLLGAPPAWWGWLLCWFGLSSGVLGILAALGQRDLKRLLAYSSVENIGIITLSLGIGVLGLSAGSSALAVLGFGGALLHTLNHSMFKGLLFMVAGAVAHSTGTRDMEHLGGLHERLPWTSALCLIGAVAIAGLPPLNGFAGEFLVYLGAFDGVLWRGIAAVPFLAVIAALALVGGLAAACFAKVFGITFLGTPRGEAAGRAHECGWPMRAPMLSLAGACVLIGVLAPPVVGALAPAVGIATGLPADAVQPAIARAVDPVRYVTWVGCGLAVVGALLAILRHRLLSNRRVRRAVTWDCGYAAPSSRMQYTASSFVQPLAELFAAMVPTHRRLVRPEGPFPVDASLATETPDAAVELVYAPAFAALGRALMGLRWLQHGQVHLYVLYIALTLVALLVWKLG